MNTVRLYTQLGYIHVGSRWKTGQKTN